MSIFDTNVESMTSESGKWMPSSGLHDAVVVGIVDLGLVDKERDDGSTYQVNEMDLLFAINEKNTRGEHMIVRRTVTLSMGEKSILRKITIDAKWQWNQINELLGKTCKTLVKIVKTKANKDFPKVSDIMDGKGFKASGAVILPFWYKETPADKLMLLKGVTIGERAEKAATPAVAQPVAKDASVVEAEVYDLPF